jgi:hypothetical protein
MKQDERRLPLAADPDFVLAQCLKGYQLLSEGNAANEPQIAVASTMDMTAARAKAATGWHHRSQADPRATTSSIICSDIAR